MIAKSGTRSSPSTISDLSRLIFPLTVGAAVTVTLGLYGRLHSPTGLAVSVPGFSTPLTVKVWLSTAAVLFAVLQPLSAAVLYGRMPAKFAAPWVGAAHRWSGRIAFLLSVPVAVHCLYALGFQAVDTRVMTHSLLGCLFYGAFTTKMLLLTRRGLAGWMLPAAGGVVFAGLIGLWITSSLWFFTEYGVTN